MRSGLFWKLFLLQMLAAATLLGGALAVTRVYAVRNFGEFIEKRERAQVHELAAEVAKAYAQTPDLVKAAESVPVLWRRLHMARRGVMCRGPDCPPPEAGTFGFAVPLPPTGGVPPPDWPPDGPPPDEMGVVIAEEPADGRPPRIVHFRSRDGAAGMHFAVDGPIPPLQLLDAGGTRLTGLDEPVGEKVEREPITVDGKLVGYLARPPLRRAPEQLEFARKEARRYMIIGPIALAVAGLFALVITALIVRPIRQLSTGAAALARREFGTRLSEARRDELGQLAADFNRLAAALEGHDTRQRQWLADIAHELRTPVAVLRGELEAVIDGVRPGGADTVRSLRQEVGRLEALIQDLHLVSLAESGGLRLNLVPADVGTLIQQAAARFRERLKNAGFEMKLEAEPDLLAKVDAQRFEQVLANLLENTALHAAPPGPVTVSARAEGSQIAMSVADAGPGVPAEALPRLFDRLYRVESARARATGGAGLGLSICKSIVQAHGGTIAARASAAGGLEIVVRLPRA